ncbi:MAG TPA: proton-conducting transporter membrane subunit, partial [Candidatus Udaeobacter sp.]|nr:proton-conducting transporter membrane subunit [Candidatus Udaeobacter sp.]
DLGSMRPLLLYATPTLPLILPVLLLLGGLAVRAGLAPFHLATFPAVGSSGSPVGGGLVLGMAAFATGVVAIKFAAALITIPALFAPYLAVVSAVAMVGGGAAALAVRSPRARLAYLASSQLGWAAAGLVSHYRSGVAASLFLLGAFAVAATSGPALLGRAADGGDAALSGLGLLRPARAAGLALAMLSLAGAPPLAGFFGELAVAASLAQGGQWILLSLGTVGAILSLAAALGTLRVLYIQAPLDEARRGAHAALPALSGFSSLGAVAFCIVIAGYGFMANPIMGLADQGAEALGLR